MRKCKTKAIQTDLDIFRHNQVYPVIIQAYCYYFLLLLSIEAYKLGS